MSLNASLSLSLSEAAIKLPNCNRIRGASSKAIVVVWWPSFPSRNSHVLLASGPTHERLKIWSRHEPSGRWWEKHAHGWWGYGRWAAFALHVVGLHQQVPIAFLIAPPVPRCQWSCRWQLIPPPERVALSCTICTRTCQSRSQQAGFAAPIHCMHSEKKRSPVSLTSSSVCWNGIFSAMSQSLASEFAQANSE